LNHTDPYELLRRAKIILKRAKLDNAKDLDDACAWLGDYERLPGAELSNFEVSVLRDPYRRVQRSEKVQSAIDKLRKLEYLRRVHHIGNRKRYISIRRSSLGSEALRLRIDAEKNND